MTPTPAQRRRLGFTLIELLVVLIIIGILIALLLPAIASAVRTARGAAVQGEISQLAQAIAAFKSDRGDYPPSRFMVNENGFYDVTVGTMVPSGASADLSYGQIAQRSITALRKFFPQAVVSTSGSAFSSTSIWYDFNGDGVQQANPVAAGVGYVLDGSQTLVFFLGGVPQKDATGALLGVSGFARNPKNPFMNNTSTFSMFSGNRSAPLFEFNGSRLVLNPAPTSAPSSSQSFAYMPSYLDSLSSSSAFPPQNVYAYFSTNFGAGYDPNDVNFTGTLGGGTGPIAETDSSGVALGLTFHANQPTETAKKVSTTSTQSPTPNPYTTSGPASASITYINNQSFQLISAGVDGVFGLGGIYSPNAASGVLPREDTSTGSPFPNSTSADTGVRLLEIDNLTNFHPGRLQ